jgi:hypothetical protein
MAFIYLLVWNPSNPMILNLKAIGRKVFYFVYQSDPELMFASYVFLFLLHQYIICMVSIMNSCHSDYETFLDCGKVQFKLGCFSVHCNISNQA